MKRKQPKRNRIFDEDLEKAERELQLQLELDQVPNPEKIIHYYRHGFATARCHPGASWSEVEAEVYQDYMSGLTNEDTQIPWEEAREWARAGWRAARALKRNNDSPVRADKSD